MGPHFAPLHAQFQSQYEELADAVDEVAERLRALGQRAPGSMKEFLALGSLPEAQNEELANDTVLVPGKRPPGPDPRRESGPGRRPAGGGRRDGRPDGGTHRRPRQGRLDVGQFFGSLTRKLKEEL